MFTGVTKYNGLSHKGQTAASAVLRSSWRDANKGSHVDNEAPPHVSFNIFSHPTSGNFQRSAVLTATNGPWRKADIHGMMIHLAPFSSPVNSSQFDVTNAFGEFNIEKGKPYKKYTSPEVEKNIPQASSASPRF